MEAKIRSRDWRKDLLEPVLAEAIPSSTISPLFFLGLVYIRNPSSCMQCLQWAKLGRLQWAGPLQTLSYFVRNRRPLWGHERALLKLCVLNLFPKRPLSPRTLCPSWWIMIVKWPQNFWNVSFISWEIRFLKVWLFSLTLSSGKESSVFLVLFLCQHGSWFRPTAAVYRAGQGFGSWLSPSLL